jgi:hypothetical protein
MVRTRQSAKKAGSLNILGVWSEPGSPLSRYVLLTSTLSGQSEKLHSAKKVGSLDICSVCSEPGKYTQKVGFRDIYSTMSGQDKAFGRVGTVATKKSPAPKKTPDFSAAF